jgi:hypothetical protein
MRHLTPLAMAAALLIAPFAHAVDNRDGTWWNALPQALRLAWAAGFLDGTTSASESYLAFLGLGTMSKNMPDCSPPCYQKMLEFGRNISSSIDEHQRLYNGVTAGQIADGISRVYADYRNLQINVINIEEIVLDGIRGSSDEFIRKRLEYFRSRAGR